MMEVRCGGCNKRPHELACYTEMTGSIDPEVNDNYVRVEEGTYNRENGKFLCDLCYLKAGTPSSPTGWVCP